MCAISKFKAITDACTNPKSAAACSLKDETGFIETDYGLQLWTAEKQLRALKSIQNLETAILHPDEFDQMNESLGKLQNTYSTATVPDMNDPTDLAKNKRLEPELTDIMYTEAGKATKEAFDIQKYYWLGWYDTAGQG